jgi:hypothetical protein
VNKSSSDVYARAFRACLVGDDGRVHESGAIVLEWLRTTCQWGVSPLDAAIYTTDPMRLGSILGRQSVYTSLLLLLGIDAEEAFNAALSEDLHARRNQPSRQPDADDFSAIDPDDR